MAKSIKWLGYAAFMITTAKDSLHRSFHHRKSRLPVAEPGQEIAL